MNEVSDIVKRVRGKIRPEVLRAKICCWEAVRTVRIRGKFTAQRMPKLPAVGFL